MLHEIDHKPCPKPVLQSPNILCEVLDRVEYNPADVED
jgi:hypothetical protein